MMTLVAIWLLSGFICLAVISWMAWADIRTRSLTVRDLAYYILYAAGCFIPAFNTVIVICLAIEWFVEHPLTWFSNMLYKFWSKPFWDKSLFTPKQSNN